MTRFKPHVACLQRCGAPRRVVDGAVELAGPAVGRIRWVGVGPYGVGLNIKGAVSKVLTVFFKRKETRTFF